MQVVQQPIHSAERLERAGYVQRIRDPADRRRVHVKLTPRAVRVGGVDPRRTANQGARATTGSSYT
jgi:hypothetical protein